MAVRLLIADNDAEVVALLRDEAQAHDLEVCATTISGEEAAELASTLQPDVIVVGAHLQDMRSLEAIPALVEAAPSAIVAMFGNVYGPAGHAAALTAGAHDYFARGIDTPTDIMVAVLELVHGRDGAQRQGETGS